MKHKRLGMSAGPCDTALSADGGDCVDHRDHTTLRPVSRSGRLRRRRTIRSALRSSDGVAVLRKVADRVVTTASAWGRTPLRPAATICLTKERPTACSQDLLPKIGFEYDTQLSVSFAPTSPTPRMPWGFQSRTPACPSTRVCSIARTTPAGCSPPGPAQPDLVGRRQDGHRRLAAEHRCVRVRLRARRERRHGRHDPLIR